MESVINLATLILKVEEGFKENVYLCSEGYPTVGHGIKVGYKNQSLDEYRYFPKIPLSVSELWLSELLNELLSDLNKDPELPHISKLDDVRMAVVLSMCYQLGISGFKKFKKTNSLIKHGFYYEASVEMCDSLWFKQTPNRAKRHSSMFETGVLDKYYEV
jgi:lysozyme